MFSGFIFTSNNFRKPCLKRESLSTLLTWFETHIQAPTSPDCATPRSKTPLQAYLQTISKKKKKKKRTKPQIVKREQSRWDRAHNPKSHPTPNRTDLVAPQHGRDHTHPLARSRRLKHWWDRAAWSTIEIAPQHWRDRTHDPPILDLSLSQSTSPFPSIVDHSLPPSLSSFDRIFEFNECFVLIFVSFKFIYWNFLLWNLFRSWENVKN